MNSLEDCDADRNFWQTFGSLVPLMTLPARAKPVEAETAGQASGWSSINTKAVVALPWADIVIWPCCTALRQNLPTKKTLGDGTFTFRPVNVLAKDVDASESRPKTATAKI